MLERSPFGRAPVQESLDRSLRLKVTDRCPWRCSFCHSEGGRDTVDLAWGPEVEQVIRALRKALPSLKEIHYTGGEPTRNPELATISAGLTALGLEVKTTTNGQFTVAELERLMAAGLRNFNFSVHSLDSRRFLETQTGRGTFREVPGPAVRDLGAKALQVSRLEWARRQIAQELAMIRESRRMGADVKVNTVVSHAGNLEEARNILAWAQTENIPVRLLNDLGGGIESIIAIRSLLHELGAEEILRKVTIGSSACSTVYRLPNGYEIAFKQIRDFKLESMCRSCPRASDGTCEEQFYGIRLQKKTDGKYHVGLCLQETGPDTDMPLDRFLVSPQLREIQSYLL